MAAQAAAWVPAPSKPARDNPRPKCDLCSRLGIGKDGHKREWCYIDPASWVFKPEVLASRIREAQQKGVVVPQDILDLQNVAAAASKGQNWVRSMS